MKKSDLPDFIKDILQDRSRGARELALTALEGVKDFLTTKVPDTPREFAVALRAILEATAEARPSMIPIMNAMDALHRRVADDQPVAEQIDALRKTIAELEERIRKGLDRMVDEAVAFFKQREVRVVMTHSYSSTVRTALYRGGEQGYIQRVIVTESRPLYEGVTLARELAPVVEVTLITDAQAAEFLAEADALVLGADAIGVDLGFVNKVGSRMIARSARMAGRPVIFIAETMKRHPRLKAAAIPQEESAAQELGHVVPPKVTIRNVYFEPIAPELVDFWISEEGVREMKRNPSILGGN
jgi:translation initiation factor 2B subunit (eIF-2B alpha/beta/delta family)